ncbi:uncharacterized protein LOC116033104 [Ipomoea triloba]|uniref:uncharacterized protein LOC116033104 n=1 Tax=Ipomoea triloba TaxID=35885 RepID=UPI00125D4F6D|nr:uncharacterized protein LOC116033104 [Ipomoea triloba]
MVNEVNQYMSNLTEGERKTYLTSDTTCKDDGSSSILADVHTPEFLNTIRAFSLPIHSLTLKVGFPVMLMGNIDHSLGLCNGTRLVVTKLGNHVVEGSILASPNAGTKTLSNVGLILKKPVFVPGRLYVATSGVSQPDELKILVCDESKQDSFAAVLPSESRKP